MTHATDIAKIDQLRQTLKTPLGVSSQKQASVECKLEYDDVVVTKGIPTPTHHRKLDSLVLHKQVRRSLVQSVLFLEERQRVAVHLEEKGVLVDVLVAMWRICKPLFTLLIV